MLLLLRESAQVVALASALYLEQWLALALVSVPEFVLVPVVVPNYSCSPSVVPLGHECVPVEGAVVTLVDCIVVAAAVR